MKLHKRVSWVLASTMAVGILLGFGGTNIMEAYAYEVMNQETPHEVLKNNDVEVTTNQAIKIASSSQDTLNTTYLTQTSNVADGTLDITDNILTMGAKGGKLESVADNVYFAYIPVEGDFTITAKLSGTAGIGNNFKGMLMVKNGLGATSPHVSVGLQSADNSFAYTRLPNGSRSTLTTVTMPAYVRIERVGKKYSLYVSQDGKFGSKANKEYTNSVNMGEAGSILNVGVAVCDGHIIFDELTIVDGIGHTIYDLANSEDTGSGQLPTITGVAPLEDITAVEGQTIVLPAKAKVNYNNNTSKDVAITWNTDTVDTTLIGEQIITGSVTVGSEVLEVSVKVTVQAKVMVGITPLTDITVIQGEGVILPSVAVANYNDGSSKSVVITWGTDSVDTTEIGTQIFTGIAIVDGVEETVVINVIVKEKEIDVEPADIIVQAEENYNIGSEYAVEVISNEEGIVSIEVNNQVIYTGVLLSKESVFKDTYTLENVTDETLTVFVTVTDTSGNTATVYNYAKGQNKGE